MFPIEHEFIRQTGRIRLDLFLLGITSNGSIKGTYDDYFEDVHIQSLLKEMLLKEESEHYEVYNDEDRK